MKNNTKAEAVNNRKEIKEMLVNGNAILGYSEIIPSKDSLTEEEYAKDLTRYVKLSCVLDEDGNYEEKDVDAIKCITGHEEPFLYNGQPWPNLYQRSFEVKRGSAKETVKVAYEKYPDGLNAVGVFQTDKWNINPDTSWYEIPDNM